MGCRLSSDQGAATAGGTDQGGVAQVGLAQLGEGLLALGEAHDLAGGGVDDSMAVPAAEVHDVLGVGVDGEDGAVHDDSDGLEGGTALTHPADRADFASVEGVGAGDESEHGEVLSGQVNNAIVVRGCWCFSFAFCLADGTNYRRVFKNAKGF